MPRFFDWLDKSLPSDEVRRLIEILKSDNVEVTTEYAIPLIFANNIQDLESVEGIIVDDVMIFGASINRVCFQWFSFFEESPYVLALFRSEKAVLSSRFESDFTLNMERHTISQLHEDIKHISKNILSTSLPIDIEYPLIHINLPYEEVKDFIIGKIPSNWIRYTVKSGLIDNPLESFSVVLDDADNAGFSNDFAKFRLFDKGSECCLEIIAPNSIKVFDLFNEKLFSGDNEEDYKYYDAAWLEVFKSIQICHDHFDVTKEKNRNKGFTRMYVNESITYTLVEWAEYLYSLSTFVKNIDYFIPQHATFRASKEDISLVLGKEFAGRIDSVIANIIKYKELFDTDLPQVACQDYVNPKDMREMYLGKISSALKSDASVEGNLDKLFTLSHFSGDIFEILSKKDNVAHHCFGESYESLLNRLKIHHHSDNALLEKINRWIDQRIDESRIAPKFEIVLGSDNMQHFRRFFLTGSNKI